jgi:hypothetical protein
MHLVPRLQPAEGGSWKAPQMADRAAFAAHFTITLAQSRQPVAPGKKPVFSDLKALGLMFGEQGQKVSKVFSGF